MSVICAVHCLVTPLIVTLLPIISTTFWVHENFHLWMVFLVVPTTTAAVFMGCRKHKDKPVAALSVLGWPLLYLWQFISIPFMLPILVQLVEPAVMHSIRLGWFFEHHQCAEFSWWVVFSQCSFSQLQTLPQGEMRSRLILFGYIPLVRLLALEVLRKVRNYLSNKSDGSGLRLFN